MTHKLLIKEHLITGLKYLCYTRKDNYKEYLGSGYRWLKHLKKHGENIKTTLIFETTDKKEFNKYALSVSKKHNVVKDRSWANQMHEQGDGGDTVSNKMWITDGIIEKYILKTDSMPNGFRRGRGPKCVFKDSKMQDDLRKRIDTKKRNVAIRKAWANRMNNKFGTRVLPDISGVNNILNNPKVRLKHKLANNTPEIKKFRSERMKRYWNERRNISR